MDYPLNSRTTLTSCLLPEKNFFQEEGLCLCFCHYHDDREMNLRVHNVLKSFQKNHIGSLKNHRKCEGLDSYKSKLVYWIGLSFGQCISLSD